MTTFEAHALAAGIKDLTTTQSAVFASQVNCPITGPAELTAADNNVVGPGDIDLPGSTAFELQAFKMNMSSILEFYQNFAQHRDFDFSATQVGRRPEVQVLAVAIEIPFSGHIDFFEDVEKKKWLDRFYTVGRFGAQTDLAGYINRNWQAAVGPVVAE